MIIKLSNNVKFSAIQFLYWSAECMVFAFLVAFLTSIGYNKTTSGLVMATISLTSIISQPIYGYLSDKFVDIKKIVFFGMGVSIFAVALIPIASKSVYMLFPLCIILGASSYCQRSIIDCWCTRASPKVNYGLTRGIGSSGYAVTALLFGYLFSAVDMRISYFINILITGLNLIFIINTEGVNPSKTKQSIKHGNAIADIQTLFKNSQYVILIICSSLVFIGSSASISFLANIITESGGTNAHLGMGLFIQAASEVPIMFLAGYLFKKFNVRFLLTFAFIAFIFKFTAPALVGCVEGIVIVQALQGLSFGIFLPATMRYLSIISPDGLKTTGTTVAIAIYSGIGSIVGNSVGGIIADAYGIKMVYIVSGVLAAISATIFITNQLICAAYERKLN